MFSWLKPELAEAAAALGVAKAAIEAASRGQGWLDDRRRRSPAHKHGRVLHHEVFYNLVMCRYGQQGRPPMLFVIRKEWSRPGTRNVLVELLPIPTLAAAAPSRSSHEFP